VLGFMLKVRIRVIVSIRVKIKVGLAAAFYHIAGLQSAFNPCPPCTARVPYQCQVKLSSLY